MELAFSLSRMENSKRFKDNNESKNIIVEKTLRLIQGNLNQIRVFDGT